WGLPRLLRRRLLDRFLHRELRRRREHTRRRRPWQRHGDVQHLLRRGLLGRVRQGQRDKGKDQCQKEADRERAEQRPLKAPVILSAPCPWHGERSGVKPADLPLDDPLLLEPLLLFLSFEQLVLDQADAILLLVDLLAGALAARFELTHAAFEGNDTFAHPAELQLTGDNCLRSTPEQRRPSERLELIQGVADLVQQAMLVALGRKSL